MSAKALLERGFCCGLKCTNCPYIPKYQKGNKKHLKNLYADTKEFRNVYSFDIKKVYKLSKVLEMVDF